MGTDYPFPHLARFVGRARQLCEIAADEQTMPRFARTPLPNVVHHIISRFANRTYRFTGDEERHEYLRRLGCAVEKTDWRLLGYALMSNHIHLVAVAGRLPSAALIRPLHGGFAGWLNRRQGTLGPVFADRHRLVAASNSAVLHLLAYVHNNPVRARQCSAAAESSWTSHRCYLGQANPPAWLAVDAGLNLSGLTPSAEGRQSFDAQVRVLATAGGKPTLSSPDLPILRAQLRRAVGPVEVGTPHLDSDGGRCCELYATDSAALHPRWEGSVMDILRLVAADCGFTEAELRARDKSRPLVHARRLAMLVHASHLNRPQVEMALALGLSTTGASNLLRRRLPRTLAGALNQQALRIAAACRRGGIATLLDRDVESGIG